MTPPLRQVNDKHLSGFRLSESPFFTNMIDREEIPFRA
jgi:hypothetical protein